MKIAIVTSEFFPDTKGGIATYYAELAKALLTKGHEVIVFYSSPFNKKDGRYEFEGVKVIVPNHQSYQDFRRSFSRFELYPSLRDYLASSWALYESFKKYGNSFDIIEACDFGLTYIPFLVNHTENLHVTCHASLGEIADITPKNIGSFEDTLIKLMEMASMQAIPKINSLGLQTTKNWSERLRRKIEHIYPFFNDLDLLTAPITELSNPKFATFGRIQYWKGTSVLLESCSHITNPEFSLDWYGREIEYMGKSFLSYLKKNYTSAFDTVNFKPSINREQLKVVMGNYNVIVIPSLWDVFNFVCIEAMALGKVVICSASAGASSLIKDGVNGFVYEENSPLNLAEKINFISSCSSDKLIEMGNCARETIKNELDTEKIYESRLKWYQSKPADTTIPKWTKDFFSPNHNFSDELALVIKASPIKKILLTLKQRLTTRIFHGK